MGYRSGIGLSIVVTDLKSGVNRMANKDEFIIGAGTSFPLHLYNAPEGVLREVAEHLEQMSESMQKWNSLIPFFIQHDIRCHEVDAYVREFRPIFIEALQKASGEDQDEGIETALQTLEVIPDIEVDDLFEISGFDLEMPRLFLRGVEPSLIQAAVEELTRLRWKGEKVISLMKDDPRWRSFAFLAETDLILADEGIPLTERLSCLKVDELLEVSRILGNIKMPSVKSGMVATLAGHPGTAAAITQRWPERVFLKVLPEDSERWKVADSINLLVGHASIMAETVARTYASARHSQHRGEMVDDTGFIVGWEISPIEDARCCRRCRVASRRRYPANPPPAVPLHLVCRCILSPILRTEMHSLELS